MLRLVTEVRDDGVYIRLDPLHQSFQRIGFADVTAVEVTSYSPAEFGGWGWGIRLSPSLSSTAYRISGDEGVRLSRATDSDVFIGSTTPTALADAIETAREVDARD